MAENHPTTVLVPLSKGYFATIDYADSERILKTAWYASEHRSKRTGEVSRVYAVGRPEGRKLISMHVYLTGQQGVDIDHHDGDTLNNCRKNLRRASRQQNNANQAKAGGRSSKYKGVSFNKSNQNWTAQIVVGSRQRHLGSFSSERDAALAYNAAALDVFGEFARVNAL